MNHWYAGRAISRVAVPIAITALIGGCATRNATDQRQSEAIAQQLESYVVRDGTVRHDVSDPNVARLWQEYNVMRRSGNLAAAKGKLQEAIAISPNDAALWSGAAELELQEKSHLRAENFAAKSNFLADSANRPLLYRNWLIIQRAREGRGDLLGAREAQLESSKHQ